MLLDFLLVVIRKDCIGPKIVVWRVYRLLRSEFLSPVMDYAKETGGAAGTVLIPMRFVWPYGGRSVFLCGSFTG